MRTKILVTLSSFLLVFLVFLSLSFQREGNIEAIGNTINKEDGLKNSSGTPWSCSNPYYFNSTVACNDGSHVDSGTFNMHFRVEQINGDQLNPIKLVDTTILSLHQYPYCFNGNNPVEFWTVGDDGSEDVYFNITCSLFWSKCDTNSVYYSGAPMIAYFNIKKQLTDPSGNPYMGYIFHSYRDKPYQSRQGGDSNTIYRFTYCSHPMEPNHLFSFYMGYYSGCGYYPSTNDGDNFSNYRKSVSDINKNSNKTPTSYSLNQNYPNPFNPVTKINFELPKSGLVTLKVYDVLGKEVSTLVNEIRKAGDYSIDFNGSALSSGVYFYKIEANGYTDMKKMMLIK
jgi:hypothetical protein